MADYDVVLLIEQALTPTDAAQIRSLHEGLDDPVTYHVLLPVDDAAVRIEAAMGSLGTGELVPGPSLGTPVDLDDLEAVREDAEKQSDEALVSTLEAMTAAGATVHGTVVQGDPVDALAAKVAEVDGREAIILTGSHVVAEFFHVDWTSQARRALGVPVLHLLEHESFDDNAGGGEGISGF